MLFVTNEYVQNRPTKNFIKFLGLHNSAEAW